jgi:hypothetical protein
VMHGDDDQIVRYADSAPLSAELLKNGTLKTYEEFPHGMATTQADTFNADLPLLCSPDRAQNSICAPSVIVRSRGSRK